MTDISNSFICKKIPSSAIVFNDNSDDNVWNGIEAVHLTLSDGTGVPSRQTIVKSCWDAQYLYIYFNCIDPDIWGTMYNHDDPLYDEEVVEAFINPSGDLANYYELEMNPLGAKFDAFVYNPTGNRENMKVDRTWDCEGWMHYISIDGSINKRDMNDVRWIVKWGIPFSSISDKANPLPEDGDVWRVNFFRTDLTPFPEFSSWQPTFRTPADFHVPQYFGRLIFQK